MKITVTAIYGCGESIAPPDWYTSGIPRPYRLYYIIDGEAHYSLRGVRHRLLPNHFYLFPSSAPFNVEQNKNNRLNHLYYDFMMTPAIVSAAPMCCSPEDHPLLSHLLSLMRGSVLEYRYKNHSELFDTVKSTLEAFLSLFFEIASPEQTMSADIVRALEYIEGNYAEEILVKKLAELLYLDEDYFIKKFKAAMGITPYAYIKNLRMAVTKELRHNGMSLKDAAAAAGFKYSSSFCRAISKQRK